MARIGMTGFEYNSLSATSAAARDSIERLQPSGTGVAPTISSSPVRSGAFAGQCDTGAGSGVSYFDDATGNLITSSASFYDRVYFCFRDLPADATGANIYDAAIMGTGGGGFVVSLQSTGKIRVVNPVADTQFGSDSVATVLADSTTWYRLERFFTLNASSQVTALEVRLDGVPIVVASGLTLSSSVLIAYGWANLTQPNVNKRLWIDDFALNDTSGADQNSWPGEGKIVLLQPISDSARVGFTGGAGGTTNLFDAVNNLPPAGVIDPGTNAGQIRDAVSSATDNYDANMQSYSTAGVPAGAKITCLQWHIQHSTASLTSIPSRAGRLVSNPAEGADTTMNNPTVVAGTWPTGWSAGKGPMTYNPAVTLGTSPVLRVGKRTASTRVVDACGMFIYVEFVGISDVLPGIMQRRQISRRGMITRKV